MAWNHGRGYLTRIVLKVGYSLSNKPLNVPEKTQSLLLRKQHHLYFVAQVHFSDTHELGRQIAKTQRFRLSSAEKKDYSDSS
jgi:hypothetical protein